RRDWGFAGDYVRAMHLMLEQDEPADVVVGTGVTHSVEELVSRAFAAAGLDWRGHGVADTPVVRPAEGAPLCAGPSEGAEGVGRGPGEGGEGARLGADRGVRRAGQNDGRLGSGAVVGAGGASR